MKCIVCQTEIVFDENGKCSYCAESKRQSAELLKTLPFKLTEDNYYSPEADMEYMSCSQYQGWQECEAKQLAKLQGRWVDEEKECFLVGNYFHSHFEGEEAHQKFLDEHFDDIFKTKSATDKKTGIKTVTVVGKYKPYEVADKMISVAEKSPLIRRFIDMQGENEIFMTGYIGETKWRMKMDKYVRDNRFIIDYKTVANIWETTYNPSKQVRQTFVEMHGYIFRAAVYSLIEAQNALGLTFDEAFTQLKNGELNMAQFFLICVSKQDYPDKEIISVKHEQQYIAEIEGVFKNLYRYNMIKEGRILPKRCGGCDYCRATKILEKIMPYYELSPEFREAKEDDYNAPKGMAETL